MMKKKLVYMILAALVMILVVGCGKDDKANFVTSLDPKTKIVRDGHLNEYPNIKIGDAYDAFFSNAQWKYFEGKNKEKVVEFSGNCMFHDKEINVRQQFIFQESETFSVGALSFNDIPQNQLTCAALIKKVYDNYNQKNKKAKAPDGKEVSVDIAGKWEGSVSGQNGQNTTFKLFLSFDADGKISGRHMSAWNNGKRLDNAPEGEKSISGYREGDQKYIVTLKGAYNQKTSGTVSSVITVVDANTILWKVTSQIGENYIPQECTLHRQ